jgi:hypothetical protein
MAPIWAPCAGLKQTNSEDLGVYRSLPHVCWQSSWRSLNCQGKHFALSTPVLAHVAHMLEVSVTDPDNPDYPGITNRADGGA